MADKEKKEPRLSKKIYMRMEPLQRFFSKKILRKRIVYMCILLGCIMYFVNRSGYSLLQARNLMSSCECNDNRAQDSSEGIYYLAGGDYYQINKDFSDTWRIATLSPHEFYVYSAYFDSNAVAPRVRVTGAGVKENEIPYCLMTYVTNTGTYKVALNGKVKTVNTKPFPPYPKHTEKLINCWLPNRDKPTEISIVMDDRIIRNVLKIHYTGIAPTDENKIAVCVQPLANYTNYNDLARLIEFIEHYKLLGASHFYFYATASVAPWIQRILQMFEKKKEVSLLNLDLPPDMAIKDNLNYLSNNECLMRSRGKYEYALFVAPEELIMLGEHNNLIELVKSANDPSIAEYQFSNWYFDKDLPDDDRTPYNIRRLLKFASGLPFPLVSQVKTFASPDLNHLDKRNKCLVKTAAVEEMGIHAVTDFVNETYKSTRLPPTVALMQQYVSSTEVKDSLETYWTWPTAATAARFKSAHRFGKELIENVRKRLADFYL